MNATVSFFAFILICGNLLSWTLEGEQPYRTTFLTAGITAAATVIPVDSVEGFPDADWVFIEGEAIRYTSVDTGAGNCDGASACFQAGEVSNRGVRDTVAAAHLSHTRVYSRALGPINQAQAFDVVHVGVFNLATDIPWVNPVVMVGFVVKAITWDFIFLNGDFEMVRVVLSTLSVGFVFYVFYRLAPVFVDITNMVRNFFRA